MSKPTTEPKKVRKAVIAAAGFGTRFLPQTKAMPKEMLPIIDKPIIQYIVEELVGAGIEDIIIVTGYHKRSVEDHFDQMSTDLRLNLEQSNKATLLCETEKISDLANFIYIRQKGPYGNATPVLNAEHIVGDEPFIYTFADDFILAEPSRFQQMIKTYQRRDTSIFSCIRINDAADYDKYGVVAGEELDDGVVRVKTIVEKPGKQNAPSNFASVAGYLLKPEIFPFVRQARDELKDNQEFYIQSAMQKMIEAGQDMHALEIKNGRYYDSGNKLDYVKTVVDFALNHTDIQDSFLAYIREKCEDTTKR